jgi:hypothetical protein
MFCNTIFDNWLSFYIIVLIFITALLAHFLGDFVFIPDNDIIKTKCVFSSLTQHCLIYSAIMMPLYFLITLYIILMHEIEFFSNFLFLLKLQFILTLINVVSHIIIDVIICPIRRRYLEKLDYKKFWTIIGFDQMLHIFILLISTAFYSHFIVMSLNLKYLK